MNRNQMALGGVLLLQALLILLFRSPLSGGTTTPAEAHPLLPALEAITPLRLELGGSDEERIVLDKQGADWGVAGLGGFPADGAKVAQLLSDLEALTVRRPVVASSRYHENFAVSEKKNEGRVRIFAKAEGEPDVDLIVGDSPNYRITHVRLAGADEVYEARGLTSYDIRAANGNWIRKELVAAEPANVVGLTLTNSNGSFELARAEGAWKVVAPADAAGREIDAQKVDDLVRAATSLRLADAVGPRDDAAHGFAAPAATLRLRWTPAGSAEPAAGESPAETSEATIEIGGPLAGNDAQRHISRSGLAFTGAIWDSSVTTLIEKRLEDLTAATGA